MDAQKVNRVLRNAIKLRHLSDAISENWQQLNQIKKRVLSNLETATGFINAHGTSQAKEDYQAKFSAVESQIEDVERILQQAALVISGKSNDLMSVNWDSLQASLAKIESSFSEIEGFQESYFSHCNFGDWKDIWLNIKSNLFAVKGISNAAFVKIKMMEAFNREELDELTKNILKNIPRSFSLLEADKYEKDYLAAMKAIEEDANKKDNLWDRLLNLLAGVMPFKESPEERVMMQRWLEGEKGDL